MEECPVCGTELYVDRETEFVARHLGRQYRFCSATIERSSRKRQADTSDIAHYFVTKKRGK